MIRFHVGQVQLAALQIYVFDPIFSDDDGSGDKPFPGLLDGSTLLVNERDADDASAWLTSAANSADCDKDAELRDALTALATRVRRAAA